MVRALACHARGRGFDPHLDRHVGASRIKLAPIFFITRGASVLRFLQRVSFCGSFVTIFLLSGGHRDFFAGYESRFFHAVR